MRSTTINRLLQATVFTYLSTSVLAQTATASGGSTTATAAGAIETLKCYSSAGNLTENNTSTFQTDGLCQGTCAGLGQPVMAIVGGSTCYCGQMLPPLNTEVDGSNCDSTCAGYDLKTCGGIGFWQVYLTGLTGNVQTSPNTTSSTSSSSTSSATHQASTVVVTAAASSSASSSGGPNKVGIAVGVVVGVVALAALIGGLVFYMKQRRKKEIEEEHKAAAAANAIRSDKSSATDSRLDPSAFSDFSRRESIGSIADERDFTRRILQVSNPTN